MDLDQKMNVDEHMHLNEQMHVDEEVQFIRDFSLLFLLGGGWVCSRRMRLSHLLTKIKLKF